MVESKYDSECQLVKLPIAGIRDVLISRFVARQEAAKLGFPPVALIRIATVVSEITRNVVQHAGAPGEISLSSIVRSGKCGLKIVVRDAGCGIVNLEAVRTGIGAGPGSGIAGAKELMDEFNIESSKDFGTTVTAIKWL